MIAQRGDGDPIGARGLQDRRVVKHFVGLIVDGEFDHVTLQRL